MTVKKRSHHKRPTSPTSVAYEASVYWPGTNILNTNHNVFNPAVRTTDDEKPIDWRVMQTRADVSYHASKNANSNWTTGGEYLSASDRGLK